MVLCQILVEPSTNNNYFDIPFSGTANIKILNIQYDESKNADKVIQIISDQLYFPQSPLKYLTFFHSDNKLATLINYDSSHRSVNIDNVDIRGRIFINVIDKATQTVPPDFTFLLITMDLENLHQPAPLPK